MYPINYIFKNTFALSYDWLNKTTYFGYYIFDKITLLHLKIQVAFMNDEYSEDTGWTSLIMEMNYLFC